MRTHGVLWSAGAATAVTVALFVAQVPVAVPGPAFRATVETGAGSIGVLAAGLAAGRFRVGHQARDLALAAAFALFALANLGFGVVPIVVGGERLAALDMWGALTTRLVAAALFFAAAFLPRRQVALEMGRRVALATAAGAIAVTMGFVLGGSDLPAGATVATGQLGGRGISLVAHPAVTGAQLVQLALYAGAVLGMTRRARHEADVVAYVLAIAAVLSAFSRLHYLVYPSLYADVVHTGDLFRVGFYATVLAAMGVELRLRYRQAAQLSASEERRRLARDLHDGLAQELAFIASRARLLARDADEPKRLTEVVSAADRALDEARRAISALTHPTDRPLPVLLAQATGEVANRLGAPLRHDLPEADVPVSSDQREMMIRVAREAVANAARHAGAKEIVVALSCTEGVRLTVSDDGAGFDPGSVGRDSHGFGLVSMRERAEAAGARFTLRSTRGQGTTVEVTLR